jgi:hypothetical protein
MDELNCMLAVFAVVCLIGAGKNLIAYKRSRDAVRRVMNG